MKRAKGDLAAEIAAFAAQAPAVEAQLAADRRALKAEDVAKGATAKVKYLIRENERLEERVRTALELRSGLKPIVINPRPEKKGGSDGCVLALASDWHVGQRIDAAKVGHVNEFNPTIAEARAHRYFRHLLKLTRKERKDIPIRSLVLWLGGDFFSGWIHPELEQTNYMSPLQEAIFAQNLLVGGIQHLVEDGEFASITVVCNPGNHGRLTKKSQHANGSETNLEWAMYQTLASHFRNEKTVRFQVAESYVTYVDIFGHTCGFSHGENVRFQNGVGGLAIPLAKWVFRMNQMRPAQCQSIGHFHQRIPYSFANRFQVNGSLCGYDTYAMAIGASPEPPMQNFQLVDSRRGFTVAAPIILSEDC